MIGWFRRKWPEGQPIMVSGRRIGTITDDGWMVFPGNVEVYNAEAFVRSCVRKELEQQLTALVRALQAPPPPPDTDTKWRGA